MQKRIDLFFLFFIACFSFISCDEEDISYSPKPRGYYRITFPKKTYRVFDTATAYKFEIPIYSQMTKIKHKNAGVDWFNLEFPKLKATLHLSYNKLDKDLIVHLENAHYFAKTHQQKATGLEETVIIRDSAKVYGLLFDIKGNTASSVQFYLTDSVKHFMRGALYFNCVPNIDSLKIVIDFIRQDIIHLINTTSWKKE